MTDSLSYVRTATGGDCEAILALHRAAFGDEGAEISELVGSLLDDPTAEPLLSLVAEESGKLLGHVLFTAVQVVEGAHSVPGQILAPLAVRPDSQGKGIGGELTRAGLERLRSAGVGLVFVLGHPSYYPRFGFAPAGGRGLKAPYPIPEPVSDAWMVHELNPGFLGRVRGVVRCAQALDHAEHWSE